MRYSFVFLIFLCIAFGYVVSALNGTQNSEIQRLSNITKLPGIALSTTYLENRILYYDDDSNQLYPTQKKYTYTGFVYAK